MVRICHFNVRSLVANNRLNELSIFVSSNNVDVLCLSETWLKPSILSSTLSLPGFQPPLRRDRIGGRGGGVAIYLRDGLSSKTLKCTTPAEIECLAVQLRLPRKKRISILTCYRPPSSDVTKFLDSLDTIFNELHHENILLTGDFNAKHSEWFTGQQSDHQGIALKQFSDSQHLVQLITEPTYNIDAGNPSLLDLIFLPQSRTPKFLGITTVPTSTA